MNQDNSDHLLSILNGQGFKVKPYPADGFEDIAQAGFYFNFSMLTIEHWSFLCEYNSPMASHYMNKNGLIQDGFQSVVAFEDIDGLILSLNNWKKHLIKYLGEAEL